MSDCPMRGLALTGTLAATLALTLATTAQQPTSPPDPRTAFILGRVMDVTDGRPVVGATVSLGTSQLISDKEGRFVFRDLFKGRYTILATAPGYLSGAYGRRRPGGSSQPLILEEGQRVGDVTIRMWREATLSGTVSDETGDPVVDVTVSLLRREPGGRPAPRGASDYGSAVNARTDDRGMYEFSGLQPGAYIVAVSSRAIFLPSSILEADRAVRQSLWQSGYGGVSYSSAAIGPTFRIGDFVVQTSPEGMYGGINRLFSNLPVARSEGQPTIFAYATTFHPSATSWSEASAVTLELAEARSGVDVQLRPVPMVAVSGALTGPNGPEPTFPVHLIPTYAINSRHELTHAASTTITRANGTFMFPAVPAGEYVVRAWRAPTSAIAPPVPGGLVWGETPVAVGNTPVTGVALSVRPGIQVRGQVIFEGGSPVPPGPQIQTAIGRCFETTWFLAIPYPNSSGVGVDSAGRFTTSRLPPGRYSPCLSNELARSFAGWHFESATLEGRNLAASPLTLETDDVDGVVIRFTDRPAGLSGTVRNPRGSVDPEATVIMLPADVGDWIRNGMNMSAARVIEVSETGTYDTLALVPGEYFVMAVSEALRTRWASPGTIEALAAAATRVTVLRRETKRQDLTVR